jgi:hypothetical protein
MGLTIKITLNEPGKSEELNKAFSKKHPDANEPLVFMTQAEISAWLKEINSGHKDWAYVKPKDRDMTKIELSKAFVNQGTEGVANFLATASLITQDELLNLLIFIDEHRASILNVRNIRELISRCEAQEQYGHLSFLDTEFEHVTYKLPKERREKKRAVGIDLFKTNSIRDTWFCYGNVKLPMFKTLKEHICPSFDELDRDSEGRGCLLIPLLPIGPQSVRVIVDTYNRAIDLGIYEVFPCFVAKAYSEMKLTQESELAMTEDEAQQLLACIIPRAIKQKTRYSSPGRNEIEQAIFALEADQIDTYDKRIALTERYHVKSNKYYYWVLLAIYILGKHMSHGSVIELAKSVNNKQPELKRA